jgi:hypothetical protein
MNKYLETLSNLKDANKPVENNTELEKIDLALINRLYEYTYGWDKSINEYSQQLEVVQKNKKALLKFADNYSKLLKASENIRETAEGWFKESGEKPTGKWAESFKIMDKHSNELRKLIANIKKEF